MASVEFEKIIKDFSTYFNIALKNLTFQFSNRIPSVIIQDKNEELQGLRNLVLQVSNPVQPENVIQDQWVEYILTHAIDLDLAAASQVLNDINNYMIDKVYFVGNQLGPIDVLMYYLLYSVMSNLTFQEKEKYLHTSRWFNNVQHNKNITLWRSVIPFSRSFLYV